MPVTDLKGAAGSLAAIGDVTIQSDSDASSAGDIIFKHGTTESMRLNVNGQLSLTGSPSVSLSISAGQTAMNIQQTTNYAGAVVDLVDTMYQSGGDAFYIVHLGGNPPAFSDLGGGKSALNVLVPYRRDYPPVGNGRGGSVLNTYTAMRGLTIQTQPPNAGVRAINVLHWGNDYAVNIDVQDAAYAQGTGGALYIRDSSTASSMWVYRVAAPGATEAMVNLQDTTGTTYMAIRVKNSGGNDVWNVDTLGVSHASGTIIGALTGALLPGTYMQANPAIGDLSGANTPQVWSLNPTWSPNADVAKVANGLVEVFTVSTSSAPSALTSTQRAAWFTAASAGSPVKTVNRLEGVNGQITHHIGGTLSLALPFVSLVKADVASAVITEADGFRAQGPILQNGATIGTLYGVRVQNQGSASVTNAYGIWIDTQSSAVTKNIALHVDGGNIELNDAVNLALGTTTGTKIGTGTTQKLGFYNATPVVQASATGETVGFTAGAGTTVTDASTFTGNVGATAYRLSDIVKHLKNLGLIAA